MNEMINAMISRMATKARACNTKRKDYANGKYSFEDIKNTRNEIQLSGMCQLAKAMGFEVEFETNEDTHEYTQLIINDNIQFNLADIA